MDAVSPPLLVRGQARPQAAKCGAPHSTSNSSQCAIAYHPFCIIWSRSHSDGAGRLSSFLPSFYALCFLSLCFAPHRSQARDRAPWRHIWDVFREWRTAAYVVDCAYARGCPQCPTKARPLQNPRTACRSQKHERRKTGRMAQHRHVATTRRRGEEQSQRGEEQRRA